MLDLVGDQQNAKRHLAAEEMWRPTAPLSHEQALAAAPSEKDVKLPSEAKLAIRSLSWGQLLHTPPTYLLNMSTLSLIRVDSACEN